MTLNDLELAYHFASGGYPGEHEAFIDRQTGRTWFVSEFADSDEDPPDDLGDPDRYAAVPHQHDLDLGKALAERFAEDEGPELGERLRDALRRRGGWRRFRELLGGVDRLKAWYAFETAETEAALRAWAEEEGIGLEPGGG